MPNWIVDGRFRVGQGVVLSVSAPDRLSALVGFTVYSEEEWEEAKKALEKNDYPMPRVLSLEQSKAEGVIEFQERIAKRGRPWPPIPSE